ncbi:MULTISPECIES: thioesterase family protein [Bacillus]|uniref:thioesterase family protein n=1 Tax=Bacillus TaxID=1386 RepID=UPI000C77C593|nr:MULTISPECIES: thioesterase [Bacillus]PLR81540.1 thioesterase [Bacillus sp. V33-4]RSK47612.1 thioesterase [Bacillus canaveralius]
MKPGLRIGDGVTIKVVVTPEMYARFAGEIVHRTYSTVTMIYHMEWASRQIILPFLEEDEEGMGSEVKAKHLAPSPAGSQLTITAEVIGLKNNKVITKVSAQNEKELIGIGEVTQVILSKDRIRELVEDI